MVLEEPAGLSVSSISEMKNDQTYFSHPVVIAGCRGAALERSENVSSKHKRRRLTVRRSNSITPLARPY